LKKTGVVEALLFDLGGVVIRIDFDQAFRKLARHSRLSLKELCDRFTMDQMYERHERGEIEFPDYANHLRKVLELDCSDREIITGWNAIFVGEISETLALIESVRKNIPCFAFTNSNVVHQAAWSSHYPGVTGVFEKIFVSSELGIRKPERRAFDRVAEGMGFDSSNILFFDDTRENVDGALNAGLQSVLVNSPADVKNALLSLEGVSID
jgi:putative hydrolase of the HAD superfamily